MVSLEIEARLDNLLATTQEETANVDLFAPIPEREECPICMIPLPMKVNGTTFMYCCGKMVCFGCIYKNILREKANLREKLNTDPSKVGLCAFCRQPIRSKNYTKRLRKLMKKNHPKAFMEMAESYKEGTNDVFQSDTKALEMYIRAAELGEASAFGYIGQSYDDGMVVEQDHSKAIEYYELAAKKGSIAAHGCLAHLAEEAGNNQSSIGHWKVAASAGDQGAMDNLMNAYKGKLLSKEDLSQTLRAYQVTSNEMKSKDRDEAKSYQEQN